MKFQDGLFIKNSNAGSIKVSSSIVSVMQRIASHNVLPAQLVPNVVALPNSGISEIGHLNVRSFQANLKDVSNDCSAHDDVMCLF